MAIFLLSDRVKSCKVSPEVWLSTLGQTTDPSVTWKKATFSKQKMMMMMTVAVAVAATTAKVTMTMAMMMVE